jgi:hypothetical protein
MLCAAKFLENNRAKTALYSQALSSLLQREMKLATTAADELALSTTGNTDQCVVRIELSSCRWMPTE